MVEQGHKQGDNVMALVQCPECSHRVSDKAESCPSCGLQLTGDGSSLKRTKAGGRPGRPGLLAVLLVLAIVGLFYVAAKFPAPDEQTLRAFLAQRYPNLEKDTQFINFFGSFSGKSIQLKYSNYTFISWITLEVHDGRGNTRSEIVVWGALGMVR